MDYKSERQLIEAARDHGWTGPDGDGHIPSVAGTYYWQRAVESAKEFLRNVPEA